MSYFPISQKVNSNPILSRPRCKECGVFITKQTAIASENLEDGQYTYTCNECEVELYKKLNPQSNLPKIFALVSIGIVGLILFLAFA